ncbi:MAG: zinc-finger domain-containing protein [Zetaproteobacteria bacterium]|nr:zinc-finger domain-containing protein [Zetaproteobacteria bacterium]
MSKHPIESTEEIVSCSDHGGHPLIYINIKKGDKACQYCGQRFTFITEKPDSQTSD